MDLVQYENTIQFIIDNILYFICIIKSNNLESVITLVTPPQEEQKSYE